MLKKTFSVTLSEAGLHQGRACDRGWNSAQCYFALQKRAKSNVNSLIAQPYLSITFMLEGVGFALSGNLKSNYTSGTD